MNRPGPSDLLLGIDLGTSAVKAGLFTAGGRPVSLARRTYPLLTPHTGWAEQLPADWWAATCAALREVLAPADADAVAAIGLSGQAPGQVMVDAGGAALGPALIWQDRRADAEAAWLAEHVSPAQARAWTGLENLADSALPPARLRWLATHRVADWGRCVAVLQPKDYLHLRLTGEVATDLHSGFGLLDPATRRYHPALLSLLEVDARRLPPALEPTAIVGRVTHQAAGETGLAPGTPVVVGTIDAWCEIVGSGVSAPGQAVDVAGTSEVIALIGEVRTGVNGIFDSPLIGDLRWLGGPTQAGGGALVWLASGFYPDEAGRLDRLEAESAAIPPGAGGLLFLPYLAGERTPIWDERARGAFVGLTFGHTRAHCARAVYEGIALAVRHVLELCERAAGACAAELRVCGGGSRSALWNRIKADVIGRPVLQLEVAEAACLGAAMLAALGAGLYSGYRSAADAMVRPGSAIAPNPALRPLYDELFAAYVQLYPALRPTFLRLPGAQLR